MTLDLGSSNIQIARGNTGNDVFNATSTTNGVKLEGGGGNDSLIGGMGNDTLIAGNGQSTLIGGGGNDCFDATLGTNLLIANGTGNDTFLINAQDTIQATNTGINVAIVNTPGQGVTLDLAASHIQIVKGNTGDDVFNAANTTTGVKLEGGGGNDSLIGGLSDDTLVAGAGQSTLIGGGGNDRFDGTLGANLLSANGTGNDTFLINSQDIIQATNTGTNTAIVNTPGQGATLDLAASNIQIAKGNTGNDVLNAANTINGVKLEGGGGDDSLIGGAGDDTLIAGSGQNTLIGGGGNDRFDGTLGANVLIASGTGNDTFLINALDTIEATNTGTNIAIVNTLGQGVTLDLAASNIQIAKGNTGNDVFNATNSTTGVSLNGGGGNDSLIGGTSNDTLIAGSGQSTLIGGGGNDRFDGTLGKNLLVASGTGNDTFLINGEDTIQATNTGINTAIVNTPGQGVTLDLAANNIQIAKGNTGNDIFNAANTTTGVRLDGGGGNDLLIGGSGNDTLLGGADADTLNGGAGANLYQLNHGDGRDTIINDNSIPANSEVSYGVGINPLDLVFSQAGNNLKVLVHNTKDQATISNWFTGTASQVDIFQAGNGQQLLNNQVQQLIQAMASFTTQTGLTWDQAIDKRPQDVQTILAANWH